VPEYLAPGVFVEEVSFRSKSIEGVATTTTGFIGPTRYGPLGVEPEVVTSLVEYERTFGDGQPLIFHTDDATLTPLRPMHNYMWHAARTFFEQGGKRLYVIRTFDLGTAPTGGTTPYASVANCCASVTINEVVTAPATSNRHLAIVARHPGDAGARAVRITLALGANVAFIDATGAVRVGALNHLDVVRVEKSTAANDQYWALALRTTLPNGQPSWSFRPVTGADVTLASLGTPTAAGFPTIRPVTAAANVAGVGGVDPYIRSGLALDPNHRVAGALDSITAMFPVAAGLNPAENGSPVTVSFTLTGAAPVPDPTGLDVLMLILHADSAAVPSPLETMLLASTPSADSARSVDRLISGGSDGIRPGSAAYAGQNAAGLGLDARHQHLAGFRGMETIEGVSIVAAPGSTWIGGSTTWGATAAAITQQLIGHAQRMRYRIAVLDPPERQSPAQVQQWRGTLDSSYAALYYPWVHVLDPISRMEIDLPPSGFVAGIYARNDVNRAVFKAPANEVVTGALGFETLLDTGQQEVLNPLGINCFRFFEGRGFRLWGARTISSDPEWKYVNLRRYFAYLEHSIDRGTQWAVFEPNGEMLWANVRRTVVDFLFNEWVMGALLGDKPEQAFFVKCDRSTMTQNDLDNGRLVCLVGVAALRPAEFVIFRVGQWTADRKV
jgi:uncharacterized protein